MTTEYKYDVGEERTERIYNALREATTYLTDVEVPRTILNFFAADLAEHPVEPTREQWDETGGVFSNLQRIDVRRPRRSRPSILRKSGDCCSRKATISYTIRLRFLGSITTSSLRSTKRRWGNESFCFVTRMVSRGGGIFELRFYPYGSS